MYSYITFDKQNIRLKISVNLLDVEFYLSLHVSLLRKLFYLYTVLSGARTVSISGRIFINSSIKVVIVSTYRITASLPKTHRLS